MKPMKVLLELMRVVWPMFCALLAAPRAETLSRVSSIEPYRVTSARAALLRLAMVMASRVRWDVMRSSSLFSFIGVGVKSGHPAGWALVQKRGNALARFSSGALAGNALGGVFVGLPIQRAALDCADQGAGSVLGVRAAAA